MMIVDALFLKEGIRGISFGWVFAHDIYICQCGVRLLYSMINWGKLKEEAWGRRWNCLIDF